MREIEQVNAFKRDLKREARGHYAKTLKADFGVVLRMLVENEPLAPRYRDHALTGNWHGCRDCHIKPDLVLIYEKPEDNRLVLLRLGSHAQLKL